MPTSTLQTRLLHWYRQNKRTLPWRDSADAYAVWASEIMLQQTRVEAVIPYFEKWMKSFPTIASLAHASEQEVLKAWEGLGYYSRARNFHKAAKIVIEKYRGKLPRDLEELGRLPGIGRYTVGALASIIYGMDEPALDGNVKRVYARVFDIDMAVNSSEGERVLWNLAKENLPKGKAADFNQALMDLGATICVPQKPRCLICPLMKSCKARANGTQELRPVKKPKKEVPHYTHVAGVVVKRGKVLLGQRSSTGLLGGMWEFPNGRVAGDPARELAKALKTEYGLQVRNKEALIVVQHSYTHFKITVHAFLCDTFSDRVRKSLRWIPVGELKNFPMGKADREIARRLFAFLERS